MTISVIDGWGTLKTRTFVRYLALIGVRLVQRLFLELFGTITLQPRVSRYLHITVKNNHKNGAGTRVFRQFRSMFEETENYIEVN